MPSTTLSPTVLIRYATFPAADGQHWAYALMSCGHTHLAPLSDYETPETLQCHGCAQRAEVTR